MPPRKRPLPSSASTPTPTPPTSSASPSSSASASSSDDFERVKDSLTCPVCYDIPRDGVMLVCVNGHNVCANCKLKLGEDGKCPTARCNYLDPPTKNIGLGHLFASFEYKLVFPCKNEKPNRAGCEFKGTNEQLVSHEDACQHRSVPCPCYLCTESVPVGKVIEHFATAHKAASDADHPSRSVVNEIEISFAEPPQDENLESVGWFGTPLASKFGWVFPGADVRDGLMRLWIVMLAPKKETDTLKCVVSLGVDDHSMSFPAPVYPIDWTREEIMTDKDCVCLSVWSIRKMKTVYDGDGERATEYTANFKLEKKVD